MSTPLDLTLAVLALWRVTHLLSAEDGPWRLLARLRQTLASGFWSDLTSCFYCLSLWLSAPLAWWLGATWSERALLWPALSGAAILLERATAATAEPPLPLFHEDPEETP